MLGVIELIEHQAQKLFIQGKRWTEVQILKAKLKGMNLARKSYLGMVLLMFFAMVMALSFGAMLLIGAFQLERFGVLYWNWPLGTSVVVFAVSALIFFITAREKTWMRASGLQKQVKELYGPYHSEEMMKQGMPTQPSMDIAGLQYEMRKSVDETVSRRMREEMNDLRTELRSMFNNSRGPETTTRTTTPPPPGTPTSGSSASSTGEAPKSFAVDEKMGGKKVSANDEVETHVTTKVKGNPPPIH